jgi:hypothetical protein
MEALLLIIVSYYKGALIMKGTFFVPLLINISRSKGFALPLLILILSSCGVNYHIRPKGACPTEGVSPLASNCPTPEEMKQGSGTTKTTQKQ